MLKDQNAPEQSQFSPKLPSDSTRNPEYTILTDSTVPDLSVTSKLSFESIKNILLVLTPKWSTRAK